MLGTVVSVNVGRPRDIAWQDTVVRTGFFKEPVMGRVGFDGTNLVGDGQADNVSHGGTDKAVFLYPFGHYAMWQQWLGQEPQLGMFGENLTVAGFVESDLAVGDVLRVGGAVLEVTEPRQPCYKVDVRLGVEGAAVHMVRTGATGCYLGLVERGDIGAGDLVERISGPSENRVSPATLHRLNTAAKVSDLAEIEALSSNETLPPKWQELLRVKAAGLRRKQLRQARAWNGLKDFKVVQVATETEYVRSLYLSPVDGAAAPRVLPGQFVTLRLPNNTKHAPGAQIDRSYTVSGIHEQWIRVTVRREDAGGGGSLSVHGLVPGDIVGLRAPSGDFTMANHPPGAPAILVSAGIGITPMVAMAGALEGSGVDVRAVHGMRHPGEDALVEELAASITALQGSLVLCVSSGQRHDLDVPQQAGRVTREILEPLLDAPAESHLYVCGPQSFMDDVREAALALGVPDSSVHDEGFVSPVGARRIPTVPSGGYEVYFAQNGRSLLWAEAEDTLADIAESAGAEVQTSCGQGVCGTCQTRVLGGDIEYVQEPARPVAEGWCLPCIAVPRTNIALDA